MKVTKEDFELSEEILKGNREDIFTYEHLKPEVKEQVDKIRAHYCTWHNEDIYGPEWKKIYLKFLKGYDFEAFNCFDFYGVPAWDLNALDVTNDDIEMLIHPEIVLFLVSDGQMHGSPAHHPDFPLYAVRCHPAFFDFGYITELSCS